MLSATFNNILYFKNRCQASQNRLKFHFFVIFDYIRRLIEPIF